MKNLIFGASTLALIAMPLSAQTGSEPLKPITVQLQQATPQTVLPANTEIVMSMNDDLTTKGGKIEEGHMFYLTVVSDVKIGDYIVIPKGARGAGEVTWKTGKGAFGKSGKMEIELRYVEVGGQRIPVSGSYRQEGEGNTVATVGGVIVAGVFAAFITGKSARIPKGRELSSRTVSDVPVNIPANALPAPAIQSVPVQAIEAQPATESAPTPPPSN